MHSIKTSNYKTVVNPLKHYVKLKPFSKSDMKLMKKMSPFEVAQTFKMANSLAQGIFDINEYENRLISMSCAFHHPDLKKIWLDESKLEFIESLVLPEIGDGVGFRDYLLESPLMICTPVGSSMPSFITSPDGTKIKTHWEEDRFQTLNLISMDTKNGISNDQFQLQLGGERPEIAKVAEFVLKLRLFLALEQVELTPVLLQGKTCLPKQQNIAVAPNPVFETVQSERGKHKVLSFVRCLKSERYYTGEHANTPRGQRLTIVREHFRGKDINFELSTAA